MHVGAAGRPRPGLGVVWLVSGLFAALLVFHSLLSPLGSPADETSHVDLVFHLAEGGAYPAFDGRLTSEAVTEASAIFRPLTFDHTAASARDGWFGRSYDGWGGGGPAEPPNVNQMPQHPPLYYELLGGVVRGARVVPGGPGSFWGEWHLARLASLALLLAVPSLVWSAARVLGADRQVATTAALVPLAVPQLFHTGSSVNNDTLLVLLGAVLGWLLARVLAGGRRRWSAVAIGALVGLALLTKAFALVFAAWVAIVHLARAFRHRGEARRGALDVVVAGAVAAAVGGWWWVRNLVEHGQVSPTTEDDLYTTELRPPGFEPDWGWFVRQFVEVLPRRFFGWFGWQGVPLLRVIALVATVAFLAAAVQALRPGSDATPASRRRGIGRLELVALGSVLPLLVAFVFVRALDLYATTGRIVFVQGRYLFSGLVPLAIIVAVGAVRTLGRWAPLVVLAAAVVLQVDAVRVMLRAWWAEPTASVGRALDAMAAWNPGAPGLTWASLLAVVVLAAATAATLVATARRGAEGD